MKMNLSKSKYKQYWQCPKMLWMDTYQKEWKKQDANAEQRLKEGREVGALARGIFGEYVETISYTTDGRLDLDSLLKNTQKYLAQGKENICEAAFVYQHCYCAVDILHRTEQGYDIYEVKASTSLEEEYIVECAYQKWVVENAGIHVGKVFVVYINNQYVRNGEVDLHQLLKIQEVTDFLSPYLVSMDEKVKKAIQYISKKEEPQMDIGAQCFKPDLCTYWDYCSKGLPKPNIFDLYRMQKRKAVNFYEKGIVTFSDILEKEIALNSIQQKQVHAEVFHLPTHVNKNGIKTFLNQLSYPLYFLDFESFQSYIPLYDGIKPYQQVPFQYSLHYIEKENGVLQHKEFLADENEDPRRTLAEQLIKDIPPHACVLAYNKSFECMIIKQLAETFFDLKKQLLNIRGKIYDLLDVFRDGFVYDQAMNGSLSIKSVLPAMFPNHPELNYHNLDNVHNGTEATATFLSLKSLEKSKRDELRRSLLAYCHLDTLAMVRLWQRLQELVQST